MPCFFFFLSFPTQQHLTKWWITEDIVRLTTKTKMHMSIITHLNFHVRKFLIIMKTGHKVMYPGNHHEAIRQLETVNHMNSCVKEE